MISELIHICVRLWLSGGSGAVQFGPKGAEKKSERKGQADQPSGNSRSQVWKFKDLLELVCSLQMKFRE